MKTKKKINLNNVTLVAMAGKNIYATVRALQYSARDINFAKILFLSHVKPFYLPSTIGYRFIEESPSIYEWCHKVIYKLHEFIETDFALLIHSDGFIVNPSSWRDDFLNYDYIGAPWPIPEAGDYSYRDATGNLIRVGNSVSLRSKRIMEIPSKLNIPWPQKTEAFHEDGFLCCNIRHILLEHGVSFAPLDIAKYFSHETMIEEIKDIKPFAFHKWQGTNGIYPGRWINRLLP